MAYDGKDKVLEAVTGKSYEFGFTTEIESDKAPAGLSEDIIRLISDKKEEPEWLLQWRLDACAVWQTMEEPNWPHLNYEKPDYQAISYYAAPKQKKQLNSMDEDGALAVGRRRAPAPRRSGTDHSPARGVGPAAAWFMHASHAQISGLP